MNILKIQTDILKLLITDQKNRCRCSKEHKGIIAVTDNSMVAFIPKDQMFIQTHAEPFDLKPFLKQFDDGDYVLSKASHMVPYKTSTMRKTINTWKLTVEDSERYAWVDEKYMKYFDKYADFYVQDSRTPIFVMEYGNVVGMILPVNRNDM